MERKFLTLDQAVEMLPEGDNMHTFRVYGSLIMGADISRKRLYETMKSFQVELSGEQATNMNHGMVLTDENGYLFIETRKVDHDRNSPTNQKQSHGSFFSGRSRAFEKL